MSSSPVLVKHGVIAEIVLNRPDKYNAMTTEMGHALADAVRELSADAATKVLCLRGAGKAFSAGGDFSLLEQNAQTPPEQNRHNMIAFYGLFLSLLELPVPVVAAIHGPAVGAGLCIALAADIRLCAREAKLGANFVRVGLHPGMGCTALLPHVIGPARAAELLLTGALIDGAEAERIGLVSRALPRAELDAAVQQTLESIASAAPIAVRQTKHTLQRALRRTLPDALANEALNQAIDFSSADLREAVAAFRAGRSPSFQGQ